MVKKRREECVEGGFNNVDYLQRLFKGYDR